jgi:hypothetical protein
MAEFGCALQLTSTTGFPVARTFHPNPFDPQRANRFAQFVGAESDSG